MTETYNNCDHITEKFLADNPQLAEKIEVIEAAVKKAGYDFKFADIRKYGKLERLPDEQRFLASAAIIELSRLELNEKEQASYEKYDFDMRHCQNPPPVTPVVKGYHSR